MFIGIGLYTIYIILQLEDRLATSMFQTIIQDGLLSKSYVILRPTRSICRYIREELFQNSVMTNLSKFV